MEDARHATPPPPPPASSQWQRSYEEQLGMGEALQPLTPVFGFFSRHVFGKPRRSVLRRSTVTNCRSGSSSSPAVGSKSFILWLGGVLKVITLLRESSGAVLEAS
ncbi:hypothetical protein NQZ68_002617 [Dissostichus eleginoides]|nr:hypothetical protein NQZ68_002617 [Dissostichus eleginoides]